ncbi:hypothetical protein [Bradyrhizobium sp.]|uniref:hypothetical protein n=1 Tax=Bradyrhizobium sp. TaxID=376 RepID=UPI003C55C66B
MSIADDHDSVITTVAITPKPRRRRLLAMLLAIATAQYTIVAFIVGVSVAGALRYLVAPQIVARFEAIAAALKHY